MNHFFRPNIKRQGRIARGVSGSIFLIAGIITVDYFFWPGLVFVAAGLFAIYEAFSGWCLARACGLKTKL